ncbi:hypothetical protein [Oceanibaculum nanhaiense]|uniref:hypothetical protein n=1 Tax=Oceanibaculum nanhaiense TaxID=1909734 RepID=UPI00396DEA0B
MRLIAPSIARHALLPVLAGFLLTASVPAAQAQTMGRTGPADDEIVLRLEAEGWVETQTAKLIVAIDMALQGGEMADARAQVTQTLNGLVAGVDWRTTRFSRQMDSAGLERWQVIAEARVPEAKLAGVHDKAKTASKPGLSVRIADIDFTPTLAEHTAVESQLRAELYRQTKEELARLAEIFPDRPYRVRMIDFQSDGMPVPRQAMMVRGMAAESAPAMKDQAGGEGLSVSRRIVQTATVILGTTAPAPERRGGPGQEGKPKP